MAGRMRVRRDDMVKVIAGKAKGRTGRVLRVNPKKEQVFVEGANIQKRHQRPRMIRDTQRQSEAQGGVIEREGPIHVSNVMLIDPKSGDPTRISVKRESGQRTRVAKRSGEAID